MGNDFGEALGCFSLIAVIAIVLTMLFTGYFIYDKTGTQTFESKFKINPDYRLEANGKK